MGNVTHKPEWLVVECDCRVTCFFNVDVDQEDEDCPPRDTDWPQCLDLNEYEWADTTSNTPAKMRHFIPHSTKQIFMCVSYRYAEARLSYRLDVRLSVRHTLVSKTVEHIVMLSSPHDSPFILVLCL